MEQKDKINNVRLTQTIFKWFQECLDNSKYKFQIVSDQEQSFLLLNLVENSSKTFSIIKIISPEVPSDYPALLEQTATFARENKSNYFITWNIKDTILWRTPKKGTAVSREYRMKTYFTIQQIPSDKQIIIDASKEILLKNRIKEIIDDLLKLYEDGHLYLVDIDATFFVHRLSHAVEVLWPSIKSSLVTKVSLDVKFKNTLFDWAVKQSITNFGDEAFYEIISRQIVYRLIGRILFYQTLRRYIKTLPEINLADVDLSQISAKLKNYFAQAKKIDYQAVFEEDISDQVPFPEFAVNELRDLIDDLNKFNFSYMPQDVIGQVFERLIPSEERHSLGQYFTREDLVDFILGFCLRTRNHCIIDPTCGSGTFLIRAYDKFKVLGEREHKKLLSKIWGVDIAHFPAELATINLWRQDLSDYENFPRVITQDFFEIKPNQTFKFPPSKPTETNNSFIEEQLPAFDCAIGNFPFIRQELIEKRIKGYKAFLAQVLIKDWHQEYQEICKNGELALSGQADIYAYLFFHTACFIKDGGRMGFITSNAWLDVAYGYELQKFFLKQFKIIAILESRCEPWFEDASVNTIVTILEKCSNKEERENHIVKFVKIKNKLKDLIPWDMKLAPVNRWRGIEKLVSKIEKTGSEYFKLKNGKLINTLTGLKTFEDENFRIRVVKQKELLDEVLSAGQTVKWGKYLRAPDIYFEILERCKDKLVPLKEVADVRRGYTTGINEFFYPSEEKIREFRIEPEFLKPVLKSPKEVEGIVIDPKKLKTKVFLCNKTKEELKKEKKFGALRYIEWGEKQKTEEGIPWSDVPSVKSRKLWYSLDIINSYLVWSSTSRERLKIMVNKRENIIDKVMYGIQPKKEYKDFLPLILNSAITHLYVEVNPSLLLAPGGIFTTVDDVERMVVPNISNNKLLNRLKISTPLFSRAIKSIFEEVKMKDRQELDSAILETIGLDPKKYLKPLYDGLCELVRERIELADMRKKVKEVKGKKDIEKVKEQVLKDILPTGPKRFPEDFCDIPSARQKFKEIQIPSEPLRLGHDFFGKQEVISDSGYKYEAKNILEAKYIIYAQKPGLSIVKIPLEPIVQQKIVKSYEIYLRELKKKFFEQFYNRTLNHKMAQNLTQAVFKELNLPEVEGI